jgi:phosphoserine phosphatase RsbU/P
VPVPAFLFFHVAGLLGKRGKLIAVVLSALFLGLVAATFVIGPLALFRTINSVLIITILPALIVRSLLRREKDRDFVVFRFGLICFVVFALWDNIAGSLTPTIHIEPFGFAILLGSLGYIAARRTLEREQQLNEIERELALARRIQLSILPAAFPDSAHFRVAARYVPMTSVAGDLYDYVVADSQQAGLLIADVSGHGVPAALIASMVKMAATAQRSRADRPAELLAAMNDALCGNTQNQYVTAAYAYLNVEARALHYAAAGHPAMLLLREGAVTEVAENGLLLAASPSASYAQVDLPLKRGDRLLLYTDGLVEARNGRGELFGETMLLESFRQTAALAPAAAADRIIAQVQAWASSQDDDLTVLICDFLGSAEAATA